MAVTQPTSPPTRQRLPPRHRSIRRRIVFVVTALGAFMASLDLSIVNVAFPALERSFPSDPRATLAWVITSYGIVFGSLLVIAGRTADRLGSRRVFIAGLTVFTIGSALCGLAPSVALLVAGRVIQGFGAAALLPASLSLLLGAFPVERRSQVVALWGGVGALAVATGPSLGAALITVGGWRSAFFVNVPIGIVAWFAGRRVLVNLASCGRRGSAPDYLGAALIAVTLSALVLGITEGPTWGWDSAPVIACFVGAVIVGAVLSVPVGSASRAGPGPHAFQGSLIQRRQRRDVPLRDGLLRDAAREHPVPHERVALPDPRSGSRRHAGSTRCRGGVRSGGPRGVARWASARCCSSDSPCSSWVWRGSQPVSACSTTTSPCGCRAR